jgi:5'-methylthioadenosine phosphorylase
MDHAEIAVIGGSGFYRMKGIENSRYVEVDTPFGKPSEKILLGTMKGRAIAFLSRHGIGHRLLPSEVNYRANLFALKELGVGTLISVSAVGSLQEEFKPMDLVIWDQFFDNTFKREKTYFGKGFAAHVSMADPTCPVLSRQAYEAAEKIGIRVHKGGTLFNMEGPQFSTRAESNIYRKLGLSIIGMTQAVEAKLARELEFCFVPLSFVTDYDCWHEEEEAVSVDMVIEYLNKNVENAGKLINAFVETIAKERSKCNCDAALQNAIITHSDLIDEKTLRNLHPLIGKYIKK